MGIVAGLVGERGSGYGHTDGCGFGFGEFSIYSANSFSGYGSGLAPGAECWFDGWGNVDSCHLYGYAYGEGCSFGFAFDGCTIYALGF